MPILMQIAREISVLDGQSNPASAVEAARRLVEADKVDILIVADSLPATLGIAGVDSVVRSAVVISLAVLSEEQLAAVRQRSNRFFAIGDLPAPQARLAGTVVDAHPSLASKAVLFGPPDLARKVTSLSSKLTNAQISLVPLGPRIDLGSANNATLIVGVTRWPSGNVAFSTSAAELNMKVPMLILSGPPLTTRARVTTTMLQKILANAAQSSSVDAVAKAIIDTNRVDDQTGAIVIPWGTATPGLNNVSGLVDAAFVQMNNRQDTGENVAQCCDCKGSSNDCCTCQAGATCTHSGSGSTCESVCK